MNQIKPRTLSGFMELLPAPQMQMERMMEILRRTYSLYGFTPLDTPAIESAEVLLAKGGGETEKQIYRFSKGDADLALRFDLTVPLAKYVALHANELTFPFRRYQIGKVYRGERAQRGRFREFYQADIDVIGDGSLDLEKFRWFLLQDYLYLFDYARVFAYGVVKARDPELMRTFSANVDAILGGEMKVHRAYMARLGITEEQVFSVQPALSNLSYTHYMLSCAAAGGPAEIIAAILSCSWSYAEIGTRLAAIPARRTTPSTASGSAATRGRTTRKPTTHWWS